MKTHLYLILAFGILLAGWKVGQIASQTIHSALQKKWQLTQLAEASP